MINFNEINSTIKDGNMNIITKSGNIRLSQLLNEAQTNNFIEIFQKAINRAVETHKYNKEVKELKDNLRKSIEQYCGNSNENNEENATIIQNKLDDFHKQLNDLKVNYQISHIVEPYRFNVKNKLEGYLVQYFSEIENDYSFLKEIAQMDNDKLLCEYIDLDEMRLAIQRNADVLMYNIGCFTLKITFDERSNVIKPFLTYYHEEDIDKEIENQMTNFNNPYDIRYNKKFKDFLKIEILHNNVLI